MAKSKTRKVTTSSGKTSLVRTGSKAEARYKSEGASFSDDSSAIRSQKDVSKAATSARGATGSTSNTNVVGASSSSAADIIKDDVTGQSFSRGSSTDTYKPYTGPAVAPAPTKPETPAVTDPAGSDPTYVPRYTAKETYNPTPVRSVEALQREKTKAAQGEINSLYDYEKTLLQEQAVLNDKDERSTSSVNTLSGLAGSTEANQTQQATSAKGQQANRQITDRIAVEVQGILSQIRKDVVTEARQSRLDARDDETAYLANQSTRRELASKNLAGLAARGVTPDGLAQSDPKSFQQLVDAYGSEDAVRGAFVLNIPQDQILSSATIGGFAVITRKNPITQKVTTESIDLGLPPQYTERVDLGGSIMFYDPSNPKDQMLIPKTLTPTQANSGSGSGGSGGGGIYDQLDYRTANAVIAQGNTFSSSPIVKTYNDLVAAGNLINGVDPSTKNPADHQAIVYNFAKALDPDSVVREGEYATIKKYSQGLASRYAGELKQAISGNGFLSPAAIEAIQSATQNRVSSYSPQYQNLKSATAARINSIAGQDVADQVLLDFEGGYSNASGAQGGAQGSITAPDGSEIIIVD